jgi:hypothetical protein
VCEIMLRRARRFLIVACAPALVGIAACAAIRVPTADDLIPQAPKFELKTLPSTPVRRLGPPALVGPDGSCAAASSDSDFAGAGIALQMSECDVVQRAGPPQNLEISANRRGERNVVMTYGGERAGIYRFVSGRLVSVERGADAPAPERPAKRSPKKSASSPSAAR